MNSPLESIGEYIKAKDGNRPHLLGGAFTEDATLRMLVWTDSISFPPACVGRAAIADTLVRRFNQTYENIYTFCIGQSPEGKTDVFSCAWLVVMSEKESGAVRVGCGRYDWLFSPDDHRVRGLTITIDAMEILAPDSLADAMRWASALPYPWCTREQAVRTSPASVGMQRVMQLLRN
jgi:hypothetical protein